MSGGQRYVSTELTHFLGRASPTDVDRYELLVKVLRTGLLFSGRIEPDEDDDRMMVSTFGGDTGICNNDLFLANVVCFCDIPIDDLSIHMDKYSRFGVAFPKPWLVARGANPVFYVAAGESPIGPKVDGELVLRAPHFNEKVNDLYALASRGMDLFGTCDEELDELTSHLQHLVHFFLQPQVFCFLKCFDPVLEDEDEDNFYMEREWRKYGSVRFALDDVARVLLPRDFASRLRADVPGYVGQVKFSD